MTDTPDQPHGANKFEQLPEAERVGTLYTMLSIVFARTFLTGDWSGQETILSNAFMHKKAPRDIEDLLNIIVLFVPSARQSVALRGDRKRLFNDLNRTAFLDCLDLLSVVLQRVRNDPNKNRKAMVAVLNVLDISLPPFRGDSHGSPEIGVHSDEIENRLAGAGLQTIKGGLYKIATSPNFQ